MRLVVTYSWGNESCCGETVVPVEYESVDAFYVDFSDALVRARKNNEHEFVFARRVWCVDPFVEDGQLYDPFVETVDEWFNHFDAVADNSRG